MRIVELECKDCRCEVKIKVKRTVPPWDIRCPLCYSKMIEIKKINGGEVMTQKSQVKKQQEYQYPPPLKKYRPHEGFNTHRKPEVPEHWGEVKIGDCPVCNGRILKKATIDGGAFGGQPIVPNATYEYFCENCKIMYHKSIEG